MKVYKHDVNWCPHNTRTQLAASPPPCKATKTKLQATKTKPECTLLFEYQQTVLYICPLPARDPKWKKNHMVSSRNAGIPIVMHMSGCAGLASPVKCSEATVPKAAIPTQSTVKSNSLTSYQIQHLKGALSSNNYVRVSWNFWINLTIKYNILKI